MEDGVERTDSGTGQIAKRADGAAGVPPVGAPGTPPTPEQTTESALIEATQKYAFGPGFFLSQLRAFVRERGPGPGERLPALQVHLADGEALDVCHIIGVAPQWIAFAVNDPERPSEGPPTITELVSYETITRVTIQADHRASHIGFDVHRSPGLVHPAISHPPMTAAEALEAAAAEHPLGDETPP